MSRSIPKIPLLVAAAALLTVGVSEPLTASSHREAPAVLGRPQTDATDFYMFRSYEPGREGYVTLIANYLPLQDPVGGPNYFPLDEDAFYDINVFNDGDTEADITFRFKVSMNTRGIAIPVGDKTVPIPLVKAGSGPGSLDNEDRYFVLRVVRDDGVVFAENAANGSNFLAIPYDNIGAKAFPDYAGYASGFVHTIDIPGCNGTSRVFVGQRRESFHVALGEIFDLVNLDPAGARDAEASDLADKNITTLALEVPSSCLTSQSPVIAANTTAWERVTTVLRPADEVEYLDETRELGAFRQVSRLGMPLVNEVIIGVPAKDRFNASQPADDAQFLDYVTNPTLPELLEILFGVEAPNNFPRQDLVAAFLTGLPGLNHGGPTAELLRLNTNIPATPRGQQENLGALAGDNAGFPNGRRPGDDVVDIELRVAMGVLCHAFPGAFGCGPQDAPAGMVAYTDGVLQDASQFSGAFPYLTVPLAGSPRDYAPGDLLP